MSDVVSGSEDNGSLENLKVSLKKRLEWWQSFLTCAIKSFYRLSIGSREIATHEVTNYRISDYIYSF